MNTIAKPEEAVNSLGCVLSETDGRAKTVATPPSIHFLQEPGG